MHAICLEALELKKSEKFLEVGAGSGIFLAYAFEIIKTRGRVFGVEIIEETYKFGVENLKKTRYISKVKMVLDDGSIGLPKEAPFDKILISAASPCISRRIVEQTKVNGSILAVIGEPYGNQKLTLIKKGIDGKLKEKVLMHVFFVPLTGKYGWK